MVDEEGFAIDIGTQAVERILVSSKLDEGQRAVCMEAAKAGIRSALATYKKHYSEYGASAPAVQLSGPGDEQAWAVFAASAMGSGDPVAAERAADDLMRRLRARRSG
jgi:hypothetical protein